MKHELNGRMLRFWDKLQDELQAANELREAGTRALSPRDLDLTQTEHFVMALDAYCQSLSPAYIGPKGLLHYQGDGIYDFDRYGRVSEILYFVAPKREEDRASMPQALEHAERAFFGDFGAIKFERSDTLPRDASRGTLGFSLSDPTEIKCIREGLEKIIGNKMEMSNSLPQLAKLHEAMLAAGYRPL